jgi:hypothetical protein
MQSEGVQGIAGRAFLADVANSTANAAVPAGFAGSFAAKGHW